MNNYCKRCRLRDGCQSKCKEAKIYEKGYNDAYDELAYDELEEILRMCKQMINGIQRKDP